MKKHILKILTLFAIAISLIGCESTKTGKLNEPLTIDDVTVTVTKYEFAIVDDTNWVTLHVNFENNSKNSITVWWTAKLIYADGYEYSGEMTIPSCLSEHGDHVWASFNLEPLNTMSSHLFGFKNVPDSLRTDEKPLKVKMEIDGREFEIDLR